MSGKLFLKNQLPVILVNLSGMLSLVLFLTANGNPASVRLRTRAEGGGGLIGDFGFRLRAGGYRARLLRGLGGDRLSGDCPNLRHEPGGAGCLRGADLLLRGGQLHGRGDHL